MIYYTDELKTELQEFIDSNCKNPENWDLKAVLESLSHNWQTNDGVEGDRDFEFGGFHTKSGNPELFQYFVRQFFNVDQWETEFDRY